MRHSQISRRRFLAGSAAIAGTLGGGIELVMPDPARAENAKVVIKYDWLMSNGQIGDVMAAQQGFFKDAGLDVEFSPGGPNSATVPPVVSGDARWASSRKRPSSSPRGRLACRSRSWPVASAPAPMRWPRFPRRR